MWSDESRPLRSCSTVSTMRRAKSPLSSTKTAARHTPPRRRDATSALLADDESSSFSSSMTSLSCRNSRADGSFPPCCCSASDEALPAAGRRHSVQSGVRIDPCPSTPIVRLRPHPSPAKERRRIKGQLRGILLFFVAALGILVYGGGGPKRRHHSDGADPPTSWAVHAFVDEASSVLSDRRYELYFRSLRDQYLSARSSNGGGGVGPTPRARDANRTSSAADGQAAFATYLYAPFHKRNDVPDPDAPVIRRRKGPTSDRAAALHEAFPPFPPSKKQDNRRLVRDMFTHAYDAYMKEAYPVGEIKPISCAASEFDLVKLPALTLIDSLDMLLIMGNRTEFVRAVERIRALYLPHKFGIDQNVSLFETNIRVLGGLLSAHQLAEAYLGPNASESTRVMLDDVFDADGQIRTGYAVTGWAKSASSSPDLESEREATDGAERCSSRDDEFRIQGGDNFPSSTPHHDGCGAATVSTSSSRISFYHDVVVTALRSLHHGMHQQQELRRQSNQQRVPTLSPPTSDALDSEPWDVCTNLQDSLYSHNATFRGSGDAAAATTTTTQERKREARSTIQFYHYDGFLLALAWDLGKRLLPAFDTPTGIPYGTVNLLHGVPVGETPVASLAGGGTLSIEFHLLSRLTKDNRFGRAAKLATRALFGRHSTMSRLYGKHIDVRNGHWTETLSGIGSNSDSFLEYLSKHYFLFPDSDPDFWSMFVSAYSGVYNHSREGEWYADVDMNTNSQHRHHQRRVFESLMAFYPGMQVLLGEVSPAAKSANAFFLVREWLGFLPERFAYPQWRVDAGRGAGKHPLRPELLESAYFLHRAMRGVNDAQSTGWQWASDFALHKLEKVARVRCGYAGVTNLAPETSGDLDSASRSVYLMDDMPSFFMSETLKYLYLTFDDDNILHRDDDRDWVFTTEAHPVHFPEVDSDAEARFVADRNALKQILRDRLQKRPRSRHPSSTSPSLKNEKWTEKTSLKGFVSKLNGEEREALLHRKLLTKAPHQSSDMYFSQRRLLSPFVPDSSYPTEYLNDTRQHTNLAHTASTNLGVGQGTLLKRACPNVYSSDLLWVHALNGGALDYTEVFVSVSRDSLEDHPIEFAVLGAAEALGALGTGVYLGSSDLLRLDQSCPLPDSSTVGSTPKSEFAATDSQRSAANPLGETIQLKTEEFGVFEVYPEPDGSGFFIHLLDTGETISTTFYERFAMITSYVPNAHPDDDRHSADPNAGQSPWRRMGSRFTSMFGSKGSKQAKGASQTTPDSRDNDTSGGTGVRRLSIADFEGNTFTCEVEVFETYPETVPAEELGSQDGVHETQWVEEMLGAVPCAPARFALTTIESLVKSGGISIQARTVVPPQPDDEYGCSRVSDEDPETSISGDGTTQVVELTPGDHSNALLHIVHRGECSFYAKSVNQRLAHNADGVIVINDSDRDVFVMTATVDDELVVVDPNSVPATVLVSGLDGEALLDMLSVDKDDDEVAVGIRISITRQPSHLYGDNNNDNTSGDGSGATTSSEDYEGIDWPFVVGSEDALSVFAQSGWGMQATKRPGRDDWQLQLLRRPT